MQVGLPGELQNGEGQMPGGNVHVSESSPRAGNGETSAEPGNTVTGTPGAGFAAIAGSDKQVGLMMFTVAGHESWHIAG